MRDDILKWISAADFSSRHEAVSKEWVENSGTWFLQSDAYKNWLNGTASNLLCYEGIRKSFKQYRLIFDSWLWEDISYVHFLVD